MADERRWGARIKLVGGIISISVALIASLWTIFGITANAKEGATAAREINAIKAAIGQLTAVVAHNTEKNKDAEGFHRGQIDRLARDDARIKALRRDLEKLETRFERLRERQ